MNGKGDRRRPAAVSDEEFAWNWDLAFGKVPTKRRLRCKGCKEVISSAHVHDMVWCCCGAIFVDGGGDYFRYGGDRDLMEVM